jgi:hypothetical protein
MNHLNAPNFILNNWLHDIWGYEQLPSGKPKRHLANGVFLDWDTSNTTVKDNWVHNAGGEAIKRIWQNQNLTIAGNQVTEKLVAPPFAAELGPQGAATHGIELQGNRLTGSVVRCADQANFSTSGQWEPESVRGMWGLFDFQHLIGTSKVDSRAVYQLPIREDGLYQVSLLYVPGANRASNVPLTIRHADGVVAIRWDMRKGSKHGFAVEIGRYRFKVGGEASVELGTADADGWVIADGVAFVKVGD